MKETTLWGLGVDEPIILKLMFETLYCTN